MSAGLELFPSFIASDMDLPLKKDSSGRLQLSLVYKNDEQRAAKMAEELQKIERIHKIPIYVNTVNASQLAELEDKPAAIFLTEHLGKDLQSVVDFSIKNKILSFSPFSGDIIGGVMAGISVKDRILPYVNMTTLQMTNTRIKPFFLKISKQYYHE